MSKSSLYLETDDLRWFVATGSPRSGTTLLASLLNSHPDIGCLHEIVIQDFIGHMRMLFEAGIARRERRELIEAQVARSRSSIDNDPRVLAYENYVADRAQALGGFGYGTGRGVLEADVNGSQVARALVEITLGKSNLSRVGSKVPSLDVLETEAALNTELPNLRFVVIVRRPFDVVNSSLARRNAARRMEDIWHITTVTEACLEWVVNWNRASSARKRLADRLLVIKYEDLVGGRQSVIEELAAHLDVSARFDTSVLRPLPEELRGFAYVPEEAAEVRSLLGTIDAAWDEPVDTLFGRFDRIAFPLPPEGLIEFGSGTIGHFFGRDGFSVPEHWGQWTDGDVARVDVALGARAGDILLTLTLQMWCGDTSRPRSFVASAGRWREVITIGAGEQGQMHAKTLLIPREALSDKTVLSFLIHPLEPKAASEEPRSERRRIGVGLQRIKIGFFEGGL